MEKDLDLGREREVVELKKETLGRSCELAHGQASSVLLFTVQWKDIEEHLDRLMKRVEEKGLEVEERMKEVEERESVVGLKERDLASVSEKVEKCKEELENKRKELEMIKERIDENRAELRSMKSEIEDCGCEFVKRLRELDDLDEKWRSKMSQLSEVGELLEVRRGEIADIGRKMKVLLECNDSFSSGNERLDEQERDRDVSDSTSGNKKESNFVKELDRLIEKKEILSKRMDQIRDCDQQLALKKSELSEVEMDLMVKKFELEVEGDSHKSLILDYKEALQAKDIEFRKIEESIEVKRKELREKEELILSSEKSLANCSEELERKKKQLSFANSIGSLSLEELQVKEQQFNSMKASLAQRSQELVVKEAQFVESQKTIEEQRKRLEMLEKQLASIQQQQLAVRGPQSLVATDQTYERPICPTQVKTELVGNISEFADIDGPSGNSIHDSVTELGGNVNANGLPDEFRAALVVSPDPAKFALEFIENTYSKNQQKGIADMNGSDIKFYILILEQLKLYLPKINPHVKAQATKLAVQWKSDLNVVKEKYFMSLLFLLFVATYEIGAYFDRNELMALLFVVSPHKQALGLCRSLGFTNVVPNIVLCLVRRNKHLEALRYISSFELMNKFNPEAVVRQYLGYIQALSVKMNQGGSSSVELKTKILDFCLAALRDLAECIEECKLESSISTAPFRKSIAELEERKKAISSHPLQPMLSQLLKGSFVSSAASKQLLITAPSSIPQQQFNSDFIVSAPMFYPQRPNMNNVSVASSSQNRSSPWNALKRPRIATNPSPVPPPPGYQAVGLPVNWQWRASGTVPTSIQLPSAQYPTLLRPQARQLVFRPRPN